ncbi:holo-ACP synthase, partial [bacterium]|nr:holo-ACP synthase [Chlamydiota bacterium]MCI0616944.1 holo-ACP synthase [bacterium]
MNPAFSNHKVLGIGSDLIELDRIRQAVDRYEDRFLKRIFTAGEQTYCSKYRDSIPHFAGRFAAKEAIAKALGTGIGKEISWKDIQILSDHLGKPEVVFSPKAQENFNNPKVLISISHCKTYAVAFALWVIR